MLPVVCGSFSAGLLLNSASRIVTASRLVAYSSSRAGGSSSASGGETGVDAVPRSQPAGSAPHAAGDGASSASASSVGSDATKPGVQKISARIGGVDRASTGARGSNSSTTAAGESAESSSGSGGGTGVSSTGNGSGAGANEGLSRREKLREAWRIAKGEDGGATLPTADSAAAAAATATSSRSSSSSSVAAAAAAGAVGQGGGDAQATLARLARALNVLTGGGGGPRGRLPGRQPGSFSRPGACEEGSLHTRKRAKDAAPLPPHAPPGYDSIEHLKGEVTASDERLAALRRQLHAAKQVRTLCV